MRNQQETTDNLPLRQRFDSNISVDRFSEKSLHGFDFEIRSCSEFFEKHIFFSRIHRYNVYFFQEICVMIVWPECPMQLLSQL